LKIWLNWVRINLDNKLQTDIKPREYLRYQNWLLGLGHSSADIANKRAAISSLNNYIVVYYSDIYPVFHNFINKSIKKPEKSFVHDKVPPTREEIDMMIDVLEKSDRKDKKQLIAYIQFCFSTGCRRAEVRQIMKDIVNTNPIIKQIETKDEDGNTIVKEARYYLTPEIRCKGAGKSGKIRKLKFSEQAMQALKDWVNERDDDCPYMFVSHPFSSFISQASTSLINEWCTNILSPILGRRVHPHCFRESIASDIVLCQKKSIESARALLGHNSSETTKIYVIGDDPESEADELFI
jgi:integrase